ncbi:Ankyrin repeat domain containing protein, partial [Asbolus verrucosus]
TYKKRGGTSDRGKEYQWLQCAYYALKFSTSDDVTDFEMSADNEFFGDFDDVGLRVKFVDGSVKVFLLQLKHSEKKKNVTLSALTSESGDFSLFKYLKSYNNVESLQNFKFILYTNRCANFKNNTKVTFGQRDIYVKHQECVGEKLLDTTKNRNCSIFKFGSDPTDENFDFFEQFYLYVNQQNDVQLKESVAELLNVTLQCDIYTTFVEFMRVWWAGNFTLTKNDVITKLAQLAFSPMIKTLSSEKCNEKTELIRRAVLKCDLTLVESGDITKIWRETQTNVKQISLTALKYGLTNKRMNRMDDLSSEKKSILLWYLNEAPLIVQVDDSKKTQIFSTIKTMERCQKKKKLILVGGCTKSDFPNWEVFEDLSDLLKVDLRKDIVENFSCSLQGKKVITLKELGAYDSKITGVFRVSQLLQIALDDSFNIGEDLEELPSTYIPRSIPKVLLNFDVIDGLNESTLLLSCKKQSKTVQGKFKKRIIKITCNLAAVENSKKHYIYGTEDEFTQNEIGKFIEGKATTHHFRVIDSSKLQWLNSNRNIKELKQYQRVNTAEFLNESEIDDHFQNNVKILTSHTGGGKTSLLNRIKNRSPPDCLVIKMNLKEHSDGFRSKQDLEKLWDYVVQFTANGRGYNDFEREIANNFDKKKIIILWDGFDELRYDSRRFFIDCVKKFRLVGVKQWISSKNHFRKILEDTFDVFTITMLPFFEAEQSYYIQERTGVKDAKVMEEFFRNVYILDNSEYLGVPLQLYILTNIFNRNPEALKTILTLTDMCRDFIDGKYTHYLKKTKYDADFLGDLIEESKDHRLEQYKVAALKTHMPEYFDTLSLKNSAKFVEDIKKGDFLGLIIKTNEDGSVTFEHNIFGEYLCALWCSQNRFQLPKHIFHEKHRNIKFMLDLLLADNRPIFVKILYKKFEDLAGCEVVKDSAGRSPLHVICTYGQRHPLLTKKTSTDKCLVEMDRVESIESDPEDLKLALNHLKSRCNSSERDDLFGWTPYNYADQSLSLGLIEVLGGELDSILPNLQNYKDPTSVLYYSTKFNYPNLFNAITQIPYFEAEDGGNLLHVAAEHGQEKYLTSLLDEKPYLKFINKSNEEKWTPLHFTSFNGNLTMLKFLKAKGGVFLLRDPSILSLATTHGYREIVEFLLESNLSPNEFYHFNYFTQSLPLAISGGHVEIVKFLVKNGARLYKIGKNATNALHLALENEQFEIAELFLDLGVNIDDLDDTGRNSYHHAAINNQKSVVLFLLKKNANYHVVDKKGRSALHFASQNGSIDIAKILIDKKIYIKQQDNDGLTPLHLAVQYGQVAIAEMLMQAGADVDLPNKFGRTPMHLAALNGLSECIEVLHRHGGSLECEDALYKRRPLHYAAWNGHDDCVDVLVKKGAQIDALCHFLYTPLHLAAEVQSFECCQLLLVAGASIFALNKNGSTPFNLVADFAISLLFLEFYPNPLHQTDIDSIPELLKRGCDINASDENGAAPLHAAALTRNIDLVKSLLNKGANVKMVDRDGYTPLHYALLKDYPDEATVKLLLDADLDNAILKIRTKNGVTALHIAAQAGCMVLSRFSRSPSYLDYMTESYRKLVQLLLDKGAEVDVVDDDGFTPLHYASQSGNLDIVKLLTKKSSAVNKPNKQGRTALHMAATKGFVPIVEHLLEQGAFADLEDIEGDTPLDDALKAEHPRMFKMLLTKCSKIFSLDTTNLRGRTVLHMAAKEDAFDLVEFFLSKGASLEVVDNDGNTPLDDALFNRHFELFRTLTKNVEKFDVSKFNRRHKCYPLHVAATQKSLDLVEFLLKQHAKLDVVDDDGNTPLHLALQCDHKEVLELLLKHDIDNVAANITNKKGQNILHVAASKDWDVEMWMKMLVEKVRIDVVDNDGNVPFDICFHRDKVNFEKWLFDIDNYDVNKRSKTSGKTLLHYAV